MRSSLKSLIKLFKTSQKTLGYITLLSFVISLFLFPVWQRILTFENLPITINMSAPGEETVKVYWDNPAYHPNAYETIVINPIKSQLWHIEIEPLARENNNFNQVEIRDISTAKNEIDWEKALESPGGNRWYLRDNQWTRQGKSLKLDDSSYLSDPLELQIEGSELNIQFQKEIRGGKVRVTANNQTRKVDLFHPRPCGTSVTFSPIALGDENIKEYRIKIPYTFWRKLQFEPAKKINLKKITVLNESVILSDTDNLKIDLPLFPLRLYKPIIYTLIATVISFFWIIILFISMVNLWQYKKNQRLEMNRYIIFLSITLGGFWLLIFYPAVMMSDAISQWQQALNNKYTLWHPPLLAILMHFTQYFNDTTALLCLIQGTFFWYAILYLNSKVTNNSRVFIISSSCLILLLPLWLYSGVIISNTWMTAFSLLSAAFLIRAKYKQRKLSFILSLITLSLAVMFRREAAILIIIPILTYCYIYWRNQRILLKIIAVALMIPIVLLPAKTIQYLPHISSKNNFPLGQLLLHQYTGTIFNAEIEMSLVEINEEKETIDSRFGSGTFQRNFENYLCYSGNYIFVNQPKNSPLSGNLKGHNRFIVNQLVKSIIRYPLGYLKHKACNFSYVLQRPSIAYETWNLIEGRKHIDKKLDKLGLLSNSRLPDIKAYYIKILNGSLNHPVLSIIFKHYYFLLLAFIIFIFGFISRELQLTIPASFSIVYTLYPLISDSYGHWRYLLLSYVFAWISLMAFIDFLWCGDQKWALHKLRMKLK